ncbi:hypothetical protein BSn5_17045 [Bacillus subtilis BSn5]|nr:hypothetical protein BSn5_17045 [Bacillus subtilis BSn5]
MRIIITNYFLNEKRKFGLQENLVSRHSSSAAEHPVHKKACRKITFSAS